MLNVTFVSSAKLLLRNVFLFLATDLIRHYDVADRQSEALSRGPGMGSYISTRITILFASKWTRFLSA